MRYMALRAATAITVAAAHSRVIRFGEIVDFDETIVPHQGGAYSLETALGPADAAKFEPVPETPAVADSSTDTSNGAAGAGRQGGGRGRGGNRNGNKATDEKKANKPENSKVDDTSTGDGNSDAGDGKQAE